MFMQYLNYHQQAMSEQDRADMTHFRRAIQRKRKDGKIRIEDKKRENNMISEGIQKVVKEQVNNAVDNLASVKLK